MVIRPEHRGNPDQTPDTWNCVDCGWNTHPGCPTKADALAGISRGLFVLHTPDQEVYVVHDKVWRKAGNPPGCLCIGCLEKRLGRHLTRKDFKLDEPFNSPMMEASERLRDRRGF
jgi:hypothetical protein